MTKNYIIRPINLFDQDKIKVLLDECKPFILRHHEYLYWILCSYYATTSFVCEDDDKIVGFVSGLASIETSSIFIWQICVHPGYRQKKIAHELLDSVYKRLKELNFTSMQFSIDRDNFPSYKFFKNFAKRKSLAIEKISDEPICNSNEVSYKIC